MRLNVQNKAMNLVKIFLSRVILNKAKVMKKMKIIILLFFRICFLILFIERRKYLFGYIS